LDTPNRHRIIQRPQNCPFLFEWPNNSHFNQQSQSFLLSVFSIYVIDGTMLTVHFKRENIPFSNEFVSFAIAVNNCSSGQNYDSFKSVGKIRPRLATPLPPSLRYFSFFFHFFLKKKQQFQNILNFF